MRPFWTFPQWRSNRSHVDGVLDVDLTGRSRRGIRNEEFGFIIELIDRLCWASKKARLHITFWAFISVIPVKPIFCSFSSMEDKVSFHNVAKQCKSSVVYEPRLKLTQLKLLSFVNTNGPLLVYLPAGSASFHTESFLDKSLEQSYDDSELSSELSVNFMIHWKQRNHRISNFGCVCSVQKRTHRNGLSRCEWWP